MDPIFNVFVKILGIFSKYDELGIFFISQSVIILIMFLNYRKLTEIRMTIGRTSLDTRGTLILAKHRIFSMNENVLHIVKNIMLKNNLKIREREIKENIESEFKKIYQQVTNDLNQFMTPVGALGDWVWRDFKRDEFIKDVFEVLFRESKFKKEDEEFEYKRIDLKGVMLKHQNGILDNLKKGLERY